jgi:hypothetical protein
MNKTYSVFIRGNQSPLAASIAQVSVRIERWLNSSSGVSKIHWTQRSQTFICKTHTLDETNINVSVITVSKVNVDKFLWIYGTALLQVLEGATQFSSWHRGQQFPSYYADSI